MVLTDFIESQFIYIYLQFIYCIFVYLLICLFVYLFICLLVYLQSFAKLLKLFSLDRSGLRVIWYNFVKTLFGKFPGPRPKPEMHEIFPFTFECSFFYFNFHFHFFILILLSLLNFHFFYFNFVNFILQVSTSRPKPEMLISAVWKFLIGFQTHIHCIQISYSFLCSFSSFSQWFFF